MLTTISNNSILSGYPGQQNRPALDAVSGLESSSTPSSETDDVKISRKAQALQKVYTEKEQTLEDRYSNESQQLEREYLQEKKRLEQEFSHKKQSLGISTYA